MNDTGAPVHGYLYGLFDLFHIGDLDLIRRAAQFCDELVVGVLTDEQVRRLSGSTPFIPFADRCQIVEHVRGVSRVVAHPEQPSGWEDLDIHVVFATGASAQAMSDELAAAVPVNVRRSALPVRAETSSQQLQSALSRYISCTRDSVTASAAGEA